MKKRYLLKSKLTLIISISLVILLLLSTTKYINTTNEYSVNSTNWVDSIMETMSPDERLGQLFMLASYSKKEELNKGSLTKIIKDYKIGGLIMFPAGPVQQTKLTNYYQSISKTPLMIAGDYEWGLSMRMDSTVRYPRQMMLGAIQDDLLINEFGIEVARQCKRLGIHINFAPVIDVNNNANNPVINSRSFGEIKENVAQKGLAYMVGMQDNNILATGKHFPGHGDTDVDSHKDLPIILHSKERLDSLEMYPFKELINTGIGGIMVAHLNIPSLDSKKNAISSLSKPIVTDLLTKKLGFKGLIFTDALGMHSVAKHYNPGETEVAALVAGVDVLLMPKNVPLAFQKIKEAIKKGKITQDEIDKKCRKVLMAKKWFGLSNYKKTKINNIYKDLNSEYANHLNKKLIESSLTLAINKEKIIPFKNLDTETIASISIGNGYISNFQETLKLYDDVNNYTIYKNASTDLFNKKIQQLSKFDKVIVSIHKMNRKSKSFGINKNTLDFVNKLSERTKVILVLFGNPYALNQFSNPEKLQAVLVSYNDWKLTRNLSAQLLFGGITAKGKLPVSAGDYFKAGTGKLAVKQRLKYSNAFELGLNQDTLKKIDSVVNDAIKVGATPGATILAIKNGTVFFHKSYGYHTYSKKRKTKVTDIYDLASITKIASTLPSLMKLSEKGKINVNKKLSTYLPELLNTNKSNILIKDILAHQARLKPWIPFYKYTYEDYDNKVLDKKIYSKYKNSEYSVKVADNLYMSDNYVDTLYQMIYDSELRPKKQYKYSDLGFILFNKLIETITEEQQEDYVYNNFYNSLGANSLGYLPLNKFNKKEIVPTELDNFYRHQLVQGYVHDFAAGMTGGVNGHAGLFSNANDLAKLLQMYLQGGKYGKIRYLSNETLYKFSSCAFCENNNRRGLGFDRPLRPEGGTSSQLVSDKSYGHSGFTGILVWIDPKYDFVYIFLSNRVYPTSENRKLLEMDVRTKIQDLFYMSFPDLDTLRTTATIN